MNYFFKALIALFIGLSTVTAQELEKTWQFEAIENASGNSLFDISENDTIQFNKGEFHYSLKAKDNLNASGDYMYQNNLLLFYYKSPNDTIRTYRIKELTDSTLVFSEAGVNYKFSPYEKIIETTETIIPSQGFSINSLWRGVLGMLVLIVIAYLFSSNRKAINWKTVGIGLAFQVLIAIGVLRVGVVKAAFEWVGSLFVSVLDFTRAGSKFLFEGLVVDMDTFGFIFAFQVLPTILFFSALTSVLFYLGIIQKVVKAFGWLLTKLLKISGAESLSVAGNIFLGQTEAPLLIKFYW